MVIWVWWQRVINRERGMVMSMVEHEVGDGGTKVRIW